MDLIFAVVIAASVCLANGQFSCRTPSGGEGECIDVYSCQPLLDLIKNPDRTQQEIVDLLKKSICGDNEGERNVCCPKKSEPPPRIESKENTTCHTPEGDIGKCVKLTSCPHLAKLLKLGYREYLLEDAFSYVFKSRCQGAEPSIVCCGPKPDCTKRSALPPDPRFECCGVESRFANKIFGGNTTAIGQYPWLALVEYETQTTTKLLCGGGLISGKYVLSAAHCYVGPAIALGTPQRVRLGEYDVSHEGPDCTAYEGDGEDCSEGVVRIPIERIITHPEYKPDNAHKWHDIALIRLKQFAPYTDFIRPICLPTVDLTLPQNIPRFFRLLAAGWGAVSIKQSSSDVKQHVDLPYVKLDTCQTSFDKPGRSVTLSNTQMCAGGIEDKDGTCKGDNGGPLMYNAGGQYEVIGIGSFGPVPCGLKDVPGVYTKVYEYLDWIKNTIEP